MTDRLAPSDMSQAGRVAGESEGRIRVLIADGDPLARRVLRDAFQLDTAFAVVAEASDGVETVELALHYRPEVVMIEQVLGRLNGIEATQRIVAQAPEVRIMFFSVTTDETVQFAALRSGACGYLAKTAPVSEVVDAVCCMARGEAVVSTQMVSALVGRLRSLPSAGSGLRPVSSRLTPREWEVLDLLCARRSPEAVAAELMLAEDTVHSHVKSMMRKLGVRSREELPAAADHLCQGRDWSLAQESIPAQHG